ncbi:hypothetical protein DPMN_112254 [Dreissena polymorpha]|uniref:Uncharacterized protein n=1 Tax=Dreissena polymorpha TaxID=45954 RepID=A0A9D4KFC9_DREPO|nr:hypothetical protein DPMN_112254 [Dreissena polymorpha]
MNIIRAVSCDKWIAPDQPAHAHIWSGVTLVAYGRFNLTGRWSSSIKRVDDGLLQENGYIMFIFNQMGSNGLMSNGLMSSLTVKREDNVQLQYDGKMSASFKWVDVDDGQLQFKRVDASIERVKNRQRIAADIQFIKVEDIKRVDDVQLQSNG